MRQTFWWDRYASSRYPDIVFPVLPIPGSFRIAAVAVKQKKEEFVSSGISALTAAGLSRALYNLASFIEEDPWSQKKSEFKGWKRKGPYLLFSGNEEQYKNLYRTGIKTGVLLPPFFPSFSILPASFEEGETRAFLREINND